MIFDMFLNEIGSLRTLWGEVDPGDSEFGLGSKSDKKSEFWGLPGPGDFGEGFLEKFVRKAKENVTKTVWKTSSIIFQNFPKFVQKALEKYRRN